MKWTWRDMFIRWTRFGYGKKWYFPHRNSTEPTVAYNHGFKLPVDDPQLGATCKLENGCSFSIPKPYEEAPRKQLLLHGHLHLFKQAAWVYYCGLCWCFPLKFPSWFLPIWRRFFSPRAASRAASPADGLRLLHLNLLVYLTGHFFLWKNGC